MSNFKLKYEDSENIKADSVNTVVFNLYQIKHRAFSLGYPVPPLHITTQCLKLKIPTQTAIYKGNLKVK